MMRAHTPPFEGVDGPNEVELIIRDVMDFDYEGDRSMTDLEIIAVARGALGSMRAPTRRMMAKWRREHNLASDYEVKLSRSTDVPD